MIKNNCIYCCSTGFTFVFHLLLYLVAVNNQAIPNVLKNNTGVQCIEGCITEPDKNIGFAEVNKTGIKCNTKCSPNCTCILDDASVISNCTDGNVKMTQVGYPSTVRYLSWDNGVLHTIKPLSFLRFGSTLQGLHLNKIGLLHLQPSVFKGLTSLRVLDIGLYHLRNLLPGVFNGLFNLTHLNISGNKLSEINKGVFSETVNIIHMSLNSNVINAIQIGAFSELVHLKVLFLENNMLSQIQVGLFRGLIRLKWLAVPNNIIHEVEAAAFDRPESITLLALGNNNISILNPHTFQNLTNLDSLILFSNKLELLPDVIFHNLRKLKALNLAFNNTRHISATLFLYCVILENLYLQGNPLLWIEKHALGGINKGAIIVVTNFATCCFTSVRCKSTTPQSPYRTCKRLLPYNLLRITIWFVSSFCILGNAFVFYPRFKRRQHGNKVQIFLISNLSVSDFFMGIYLIILLSVDMYFKDYFPAHSESWRRSVLCRIAGALSVCASEASTFFITLITIDRFLGVKYTYHVSKGIHSARLIVALLWLIAFGIAIAVFVLSQTDSDIYAVSEVCVGLPMSRRPFHLVHNTKIRFTSSIPQAQDTLSNVIKSGSKVAMFFSIVLFIGLNLICFFIIGYCYVSMFVYARQTSKQSGRSSNLNEQIRMAVKMSLIVFTDFCCWVPVGILSILVQAWMVEVDPVAYAWIATFVLPINSSINPFLYTLASLTFDKMKSSARKSCTRQSRETHLSMSIYFRVTKSNLQK